MEQEGPTINSWAGSTIWVSVLVKAYPGNRPQAGPVDPEWDQNEDTASKSGNRIQQYQGKLPIWIPFQKMKVQKIWISAMDPGYKRTSADPGSVLTATGMTAAVVDMKGKYITRGNSFTSFYSRYTNGKHNELREFTQDLTVGGFRAGTVIGGIVLGDYPDDSAPSQEVVSAGGQLLAEMLNLWANALYYRKSNADSVEAFAKRKRKYGMQWDRSKYKGKGTGADGYDGKNAFPECSH